MKIGLRINEFIKKIWKDPVWSIVIATGILGLITIGWAKITNHSWSEIYNFILSFLSYKVPIFIFISIFGIYFIVKKFIQLFKKKKDLFWNEPMGNYTFKELHNFLLLETFAVRTVGMEISGRSAPTDNLLNLFRIYYTLLNKGVGIADHINDGGYLYNVLAPRLVGFGLVDTYQKPDDNLPDVTDIAYKTSALGHKFHSSLDKIILAEKIKNLKTKKV